MLLGLSKNCFGTFKRSKTHKSGYKGASSFLILLFGLLETGYKGASTEGTIMFEQSSLRVHQRV
jgi:hypothetical protein